MTTTGVAAAVGRTSDHTGDAASATALWDREQRDGVKVRYKGAKKENAITAGDSPFVYFFSAATV